MAAERKSARRSKRAESWQAQWPRTPPMATTARGSRSLKAARAFVLTATGKQFCSRALSSQALLTSWLLGIYAPASDSRRANKQAIKIESQPITQECDCGCHWARVHLPMHSSDGSPVNPAGQAHL